MAKHQNITSKGNNQPQKSPVEKVVNSTATIKSQGQNVVDANNQESVLHDIKKIGILIGIIAVIIIILAFVMPR